MSSPFDKLSLRARQWNVAIEHTRETSGSLLAFGVREDTRVVLKISKHEGDEWQAGEINASVDELIDHFVDLFLAARSYASM